eukprot:CAMPEP_0201258332 /NCGR_PEP_ID=MMETSP0853-20130426/2595_1 /ASSEMBLY_ACC=CAM_ASM_000640 /TAXON_ID=183588 /ORGANISM="Pseudo-nitzschia fraudulenta, Strain WWA7" /LENGTH=45 /DNA_ID= /DNA_START= /DNA_END= /DNA_ORIENTATION=
MTASDLKPMETNGGEAYRSKKERILSRKSILRLPASLLAPGCDAG